MPAPTFAADQPAIRVPTYADVRANLYRRCLIGGDEGAAERMAENMAAGREVLG